MMPVERGGTWEEVFIYTIVFYLIFPDSSPISSSSASQ
jgi:hypothetical protein